MKVSVAPVAPPMPPETGASMGRKPLAVASLCKARALSRSMVEQSIGQRARQQAVQHGLPNLARIAPSGSMVISASAPLVAS